MAGIMERLKLLIAWALARKPVRAFLLYSEGKGALLASAVTYRALFSIFAGVLLGFSIAAIWLAGRPDLWQALISAVNSVIPGLVGEDALIKPSLLEEPASFSVTGVISLIGLLVASIGAVGALREAIRMLAGTSRSEVPGVILMLRDLLFAVVFGALLVAAALTTFLGSAFVSLVLDWLGLGQSGLAEGMTRAVAALVTLALDTVLVALMFWMLSGVRASPRAVWSGALIGGAGLLVLQQLSGLFVGGATSNPLLGAFASLIALLLWVNLSAQVLLIASAYILVGVDEQRDRVGERFAATTFAQRRVRRAERSVQAAVGELEAARAAERTEHEQDLRRLREHRD
ncbi:YihY/virulence factor BrkB family protein [Microbacterium lacusdiani]